MTVQKVKKASVSKRVGLDRHHKMGSVAATLNLLELFARNNTNALQFSDFVEGSGRPKSSVHRMLSTLINTGFIVQDEDTRKYCLTLKLWRLGVPALGRHDLSLITRPYLEALMRKTDETVHLAVSTGDGNIVYVAKFESQRSIRVQTQLGGTVPSYCTATGRSILANDQALWEIVRETPMQARTDRTETSHAALEKILEDVRAKCYAVTRGEMHKEMGGIAAPIFGFDNRIVGSFGVAFPLFRMTDETVEKCISEVLATAKGIAKLFDGSASGILAG